MGKQPINRKNMGKTGLIKFLKQLINFQSLDQEDAQRRKLLNFFLFILAGIGAGFIIFLFVVDMILKLNYLRDPAFIQAIFSMGLFLASAIAIFFINRFVSGYIASIIFLFAFTFVLLLTDDPAYLVSGRSQYILILPIIIGGILIRPYVSLVLAVVNSLLLSLISWSINASPNLFIILFFFLIAIISWIAARNHARALQDLRAANNRLQSELEQRNKVERTLRVTEEKYHSLVNNFQGIIFKTDLEFEPVIFEGEVEGITGYTKDSFLHGRIKWEHIVCQEDFGGFRGSHEDLRAGRIGICEVEYRIIKRDGTVRWVNEFVQTVRNRAGEPGSLQGFIYDITDRKSIDLALEETQKRLQKDGQALRESQYLLKKVFDNLQDAVFIIDGSSPVFIEANPAATRIFGYQHGEFLQNSTGMIHVNRDLEQDFSRSLSEAVKNRKILKNFEFRMKRKDGSVFPTEQTVVPLEDEKGTPFGWLFIIRSIARRKLLEEQLLHSQKMEALGRLAGGVAHDFNNLLTTILGYCQLSAAEPGLGGVSREALTEIRKAAERAASLTHQLLSFSRKQMLQPRIVNLNEMVRNTKKMLGRLIGEDITFITKLEENLWLTRIDPGQLEQVVTNLIVNARDAITANGIIKLETANCPVNEFQFTELDAGEYILLTVSDNGRGMDEDTLHRIFEPFFTTKEQGKGVGLGLSTVFGIIKQSNWHIEVESEINRGTTFTIYLPRSPGTIPDADPRTVPLEGKEGSETILFVEDDDALRTMIRKILAKQGYNVVEAASGPEALSIVRERPDFLPDLLITDVVMPHMSGIELTAALNGQFPGLKVITISGYADDSLMDRTHLPAGNYFLQKPFAPMELVERIRIMLDESPG
jgi:two-component system, cell cycle sensor histidine kinase and response regulator CckA